MGVKWRDFQMPKRLDCDESSYTDTYGKFVAEPFENPEKRRYPTSYAKFREGRMNAR